MVSSDYERNFTSVNKPVTSAEAGPAVYRSLWSLGFTLVFKMLITVFTFGIKVPAGIFIPSLAFGKSGGAFVGDDQYEILVPWVATVYSDLIPSLHSRSHHWPHSGGWNGTTRLPQSSLVDFRWTVLYGTAVHHTRTLRYGGCSRLPRRSHQNDRSVSFQQQSMTE